MWLLNRGTQGPVHRPIRPGDLDARTADNIGSDELGNAAATTKAVATGDPRYLQQGATR